MNIAAVAEMEGEKLTTTVWGGLLGGLKDRAAGGRKDRATGGRKDRTAGIEKDRGVGDGLERAFGGGQVRTEGSWRCFRLFRNFCSEKIK